MAGRQPYQPPPPVSFNVVPGRNRTQKWNVAKTYDYSGEDWGGYDPYDEYGGYDQPAPPVPQQQTYSARSRRQNSFDVDAERRQFSAGPVMYGGDGSRTRSMTGSSRGEYQHARSRSRDFTEPGQASPRRDYQHARSRSRDFTDPGQAPPPLSPSSRARSAAPTYASYPRRGSSAGSATTPQVDKELPQPPFIRPSDIYARVEAERVRERQSQDGGRPSMDTLQRETSMDEPRPPLPSTSRSYAATQTPASFNEPSQPPAQSTSGYLDRSRGISVEQNGSSPITNAPLRTEPLGEMLRDRTYEPPRSTRSTQATAPRDGNKTESTFNTPTATRPSVGSDPAADILAERQALPSAANIGRHPDDLVHQPSQGYRSVVNKAFDQPPSTSRATQADSDVSRSNTQSTSNISPIMSRVPSNTTTQAKQQERNVGAPPIAEESSSRPTSGSQAEHQATPSATVRDVGLAGAAVTALAAGATAIGATAGYRRSLDPPAHDNSPARTPGLENASSRRLSQGMTAETLSGEAPDVPDQGVEMMPSLQPIETPASEIDEAAALSDASRSDGQQPGIGRPRAGTDYSLRESDIAEAVNASTESPGYSPEAAEVEKFNQNLFLREHAGTPGASSPVASPPGAGLESGRNSPAKGRVREIAGKYQDIHNASRNNSTTSLASSKSSWSNFRGSQEDLSRNLPTRNGTGDAGTNSKTDYGTSGQEDLRGSTEPNRPQMRHEPSFQPQLPGQWTSLANSAASTPAEEYNSALQETPDSANTPRESHLPDIEPTTAKVPLEVSNDPDFTPTASRAASSQHPQYSSAAPDTFSSPLTQVKDAGTALGAAFLASVGLGHQTRDFGSQDPAQPVSQPEGKPRAGEVAGWRTQRPDLFREDTETTNVTASSANSAAPTPLPRDDRYYFSGAPLNTGRSRDGSPTLPEVTVAPSRSLSTFSGPEDTQSDRLRHEIVRTLEKDDAERTQDALDAPDNARAVELVDPAQAERPTRPQLPLQRFSWENDAELTGTPDLTLTQFDSSNKQNEMDLNIDAPPTPPPLVRVPDPESSPEIKPEMPYERPRSRGLRIMNTEGDSDDGEETRTTELLSPSVAPVSPITKSQEGLHARALAEATDGSLSDLTPSPVPSQKSEVRQDEDDRSRFVPSYSTQDPDAPDFAERKEEASTTPDYLGGAVPLNTMRADPETKPTISEQVARSPSETAPAQSNRKIPPFREILAIKSPSDRIKAYDSTRQTFADLDTGLSDWLSRMLEQHPEHTNLTTSAGRYPGPGHKGTNNSLTSPMVSPEAFNSKTLLGKDLMKGAGVLGGKAQAGAKGLLAKGRSRFGSKREVERSGPGKVLQQDPSLPFVPSASASQHHPEVQGNQSLSSQTISSSATVPATAGASFPTTRDISDFSSIVPGSTSSPDAQKLAMEPSDPVEPPPRSRSRTPSSLSSISQPMTRTLSRFRSRSRSKSASRSSNRSRPTSLALTNPDLLSEEEEHPMPVPEPSRELVGSLSRRTSEPVDESKTPTAREGSGITQTPPYDPIEVENVPPLPTMRKQRGVEDFPPQDRVKAETASQFQTPTVDRRMETVPQQDLVKPKNWPQMPIAPVEGGLHEPPSQGIGKLESPSEMPTVAGRRGVEVISSQEAVKPEGEPRTLIAEETHGIAAARSHEAIEPAAALKTPIRSEVHGVEAVPTSDADKATNAREALPAKEDRGVQNLVQAGANPNDNRAVVASEMRKAKEYRGDDGTLGILPGLATDKSSTSTERSFTVSSMVEHPVLVIGRPYHTFKNEPVVGEMGSNEAKTLDTEKKHLEGQAFEEEHDAFYTPTKARSVADGEERDLDRAEGETLDTPRGISRGPAERHIALDNVSSEDNFPGYIVPDTQAGPDQSDVDSDDSDSSASPSALDEDSGSFVSALEPSDVSIHRPHEGKSHSIRSSVSSMGPAETSHIATREPLLTEDRPVERSLRTIPSDIRHSIATTHSSVSSIDTSLAAVETPTEPVRDVSSKQALWNPVERYGQDEEVKPRTSISSMGHTAESAQEGQTTRMMQKASAEPIGVAFGSPSEDFSARPSTNSYEGENASGTATPTTTFIQRRFQLQTSSEHLNGRARAEQGGRARESLELWRQPLTSEGADSRQIGSSPIDARLPHHASPGSNQSHTSENYGYPSHAYPEARWSMLSSEEQYRGIDRRSSNRAPSWYANTDTQSGTAFASGPSPRHITDTWGLEDLHNGNHDNIEDEEAITTEEQQSTRRRSSLLKSVQRTSSWHRPMSRRQSGNGYTESEAVHAEPQPAYAEPQSKYPAPYWSKPRSSETEPAASPVERQVGYTDPRVSHPEAQPSEIDRAAEPDVQHPTRVDSGNKLEQSFDRAGDSQLAKTPSQQTDWPKHLKPPTSMDSQQQVQRSGTIAHPQSKKQRGLSKFGSIFGRSSAGESGQNRTRLVKEIPQERATSTRQGSRSDVGSTRGAPSTTSIPPVPDVNVGNRQAEGPYQAQSPATAGSIQRSESRRPRRLSLEMFRGRNRSQSRQRAALPTDPAQNPSTSSFDRLAATEQPQQSTDGPTRSSRRLSLDMFRGRNRSQSRQRATQPASSINNPSMSSFDRLNQASQPQESSERPSRSSRRLSLEMFNSRRRSRSRQSVYQSTAPAEDSASRQPTISSGQVPYSQPYESTEPARPRQAYDSYGMPIYPLSNGKPEKRMHSSSSTFAPPSRPSRAHTSQWETATSNGGYAPGYPPQTRISSAPTQARTKEPPMPASTSPTAAPPSEDTAVGNLWNSQVLRQIDTSNIENTTQSDASSTSPQAQYALSTSPVASSPNSKPRYYAIQPPGKTSGRFSYNGQRRSASGPSPARINALNSPAAPSQTTRSSSGESPLQEQRTPGRAEHPPNNQSYTGSTPISRSSTNDSPRRAEHSSMYGPWQGGKNVTPKTSEVEMRGASYPGQEWMPKGLESV